MHVIPPAARGWISSGSRRSLSAHILLIAASASAVLNGSVRAMAGRFPCGEGPVGYECDET